MKRTVYKTQGTCSQYIEVAVEDDKVADCQIYSIQMEVFIYE